MLSNVLKSLYAAPSFLKAAYKPHIHTTLRSAANLSWTCVFNQTDKQIESTPEIHS